MRTYLPRHAALYYNRTFILRNSYHVYCFLPAILQGSISHFSWIDLFAFPRLRDNELQALTVTTKDEDELCWHTLEIKDPVNV